MCLVVAVSEERPVEGNYRDSVQSVILIGMIGSVSTRETSGLYADVTPCFMRHVRDLMIFNFLSTRTAHFGAVMKC